MKHIVQTRLIHLKKDWISLLFWLAFPIFATVFIIQTTNTIQDNTKVPVGIVLEEESDLALALYEEIKATPLIRAIPLAKAEAMTKLTKHELDSVFVIRNGYEENILRNNRNRLIDSYQSDLSFAYAPVSEMIVSFVQQDVSRFKAVQIIHDLSDHYASKQTWTSNEIIEQSKKTQVEQSLLHTAFSFYSTKQTNHQEGLQLLKPWSLWAVFTLLSTLLLSDWVIKERRSNTLSRFAFTRVTLKKYRLQNLLIYTVLSSLSGIIASSAFSLFLNEPMTVRLVINLLLYQLMLSTGAFLFSLLFKNMYLYYSTSFALSLVMAIASGAIIPIEGITNHFSWIEIINPLHPFLTLNYFNMWLIYFIICIAIWFVRKGKSYV